MPITSSNPCIVPSSPPGPCSAKNTNSIFFVSSSRMMDRAASMAWEPSRLSDDLQFQLQGDAGALLHRPPHLFDQRDDVCGPRPADIHDEIGVLLRDLGISNAQAFETDRLNQLPCRLRPGILEDAAGVRQRQGL